MNSGTRFRDRLFVAVAVIALSILAYSCASAETAPADSTRGVLIHALAFGNVLQAETGSVNVTRELPQGIRYDASSGKYLDDVRFAGAWFSALSIVSLAANYAMGNLDSPSDAKPFFVPITFGLGLIAISEPLANHRMRRSQ